MKGKECKIVQDLLPNYIDKINSEETNQYIEQHLKECEECTKVYNNMKANNHKTTSKEKTAVNYLKKYKNKLRILKTILLIVVIVFIALTIRKIVIISNIEGIAKNTGIKDNYYIEQYSLQGGSVSIMRSYHKQEKYLTTYDTYGINFNDTRRMTIYHNGNEHLNIIEVGEEKIASPNGLMQVGGIKAHAFSMGEDMNFFAKLFATILANVSEDEISGRKCYYIELTNEWKLWVDKETGLKLREINSKFTTDYSYKFDIVNDEDVQKPDTSDCNIMLTQNN